MANSGETLWERRQGTGLILINLFKRKEHRCTPSHVRTAELGSNYKNPIMEP